MAGWLDYWRRAIGWKSAAPASEIIDGPGCVAQAEFRATVSTVDHRKGTVNTAYRRTVVQAEYRC